MGQLIFETVLNGVQFGVFLFLISAGLTLVFGIMNMVNLAHGSLFMMGAYIGSYVFQQTGSFALAVVIAIPFSLLLGILLEFLALRTLYARDHLDQVLATFGFILFFNQLVLRVFGATSQEFRLPDAINFPMPLFGFTYPSYRLIVIVVGLAVGAGLYLVIAKTRMGMLIRAGASNRAMVGALGVNIRMLFTLIFGIGAALAGLAGVMIGPIESVESGMGENKLILAFVVIVIGGIGSIRGAFIASIIVGLVEVIGRVFMKDILRTFLPEEFAQTAGPALASMSIYILMAAVLYFRPQGLFPARTG
ncbi:MAG: branched-chain amino acid ABC transporter permease [Alphaproteobacteria bacterium]|nr:branched-chain amino acid ABC transporter permease [Candidatus Odyssella sp.]